MGRKLQKELLDHLIVLNEAHLRRLMRDYISYYHADRTHDSLEKDAPERRPITSKPCQSAQVVSCPRTAVCIIDMIGGKLPEEVIRFERAPEAGEPCLICFPAAPTILLSKRPDAHGSGASNHAAAIEPGGMAAI